MLKGSFKFNLNLVKEYEDEINKLLTKYDVSKKHFNITLHTNDWISELNIKELKKIIIAFSNINDLIDITLMDKDSEFKNYNAMKNLFLIDLSQNWDSDITMSSAFNVMKVIDDLEEKNHKCILYFSIEEMKDSVIDMFKDMRYHKLRSQLNIIARFQEFYENQVYHETKWRDIRKHSHILNILDKEPKKIILTKKILMDMYCGMEDNPQDAVIPLLIFEGISYSKLDDSDELRYLRKEDLKGENLHIYGNGHDKSNVRKIKLDSDIAAIVKKAIYQDNIIKKIRYEEKFVELQETQYILRPTINSRKKIEKLVDDNILSFRGAYSRINACNNIIEPFIGDIRFTPKQIEKYGKIYYIDKYIAEGLEVNDAIRKVLKRFGDWYTGGKDAANPKNEQLVNRLKKEWSILSELKEE